MAITTTQFTNLVDSIAKTLVDLEAAEITTSAATLANVITGQGGGTTGLVARANALTPVGPGLDIPAVAQRVGAKIVAAASPVAPNYYSLYAPLIAKLDAEVGGLQQYLFANSLQVHPEFANLIANLNSTQGTPAQVGPISPANIFLAAESAALGSIAVTGAAASTFTAGTAIDLTKFAPAPLYLKNTKAGTSGGTATAFSITYTNAAGTAGQTATFTLPGAQAANAILSLAITGSAVSAFSVTGGGVAADAWAIVGEPLRTIAY